MQREAHRFDRTAELHEHGIAGCPHQTAVRLDDHKGALAMYFLDRLKPEFSQDPAGVVPNKAFQTAVAGGGTKGALPR